MQEMLDIMKSIYDMMGKYTYPTMQDDTPREHVESFFQVCLNSLHCFLLQTYYWKKWPYKDPEVPLSEQFHQKLITLANAAGIMILLNVSGYHVS